MDDLDPDIGQALERLARSQPTAPAIHVPGRTSLTYADLGAQIRYVRERLSAWEIGRGDIVAGVIPLRPEMAVACATVPAAATFAPLSPGFMPDVYSELLARLRPKALLVPADLDHPVRLAARRCGVAEIELVPDPSAPAGMFTLKMARQDESLARAGSARPNWAHVLNTSGTTGRPKLVPRSHLQLALYAQSLGDWLGLMANDVGCHLMPMHHSSGLNTALMPQLLRGASVVCLPESDIDGFFAALDEYRITWLTAVPTVHREILRRAPDFHEAVLRNRLRFIRVNSGQLEPDEVDRFEQTFGVPLLMGFGLTEFLMITQDPLPPRMRKRGSVGLPLCNQVAIMSEAGAICATGDVGEIVVRGPMVFEGYFDDAQATAAAFVDGWFRTGDLGRFDEEGYLYLVGRIKDLINRGGEKISPVEIDAAIEAVPGVRAAATFAIPHHSLGEEIVAAVVRDGDMAIEASDIIDQVRRRMGPTRVPRKIYFVDQLPRTDSGKVRRSELPRLLGLDQADAAVANESAVVGPAPISPLEAALVGLWSSVLQVSSVGVNNDFFLLGGDSIKAMRLTNQLQQALGEVIHPTLLFTTPTISQMADYLQQHYFDALAAHNLIDGQNHLLTQMRSLRLANEAQIDSSAIAAFRGRLPVQASPPLLDGPPNPPAIFVLSPGRSGTTLLRVLLAGHPRLFAPPELHLLRHNTLLERKAALTGPQRFRLEGALRALMQANACDLPTAQQLMAEMEARDISVQGFYARLQHAIGNQILVDNTPNYALDPAALHRAEVTFRQPYYIHLLRSPYGMIHSWDETHMDQVYPYQQIYSPRRIAELIWLISHQHILAFLAGVPGERHYRLRFEDLLRAPEREIRALCRFLHIDFVPTMLQPYADKQQRMTDGLHPESRMIGDVKFHQHQGIDPSVADRWRAHYTTDFLSDMTWEVAEILGYQRADLHRARIA